MENHTFVSNKISVLQVLGGLIRDPSLFLGRQYPLTQNDFPEQFHKIVFGALEHLACAGAKVITAMDVDQYLVNYGPQYRVFTDNNGIDYITRAAANCELGNFEYYYKVLRKYSLLHRCKKMGFDISEIYDDTITDPIKMTKMQERFEEMTVNDILAHFESRVSSLKYDYGVSSGMDEYAAGSDIEDLIAKYEQTPEMGMPLTSHKMTTMFRGRRLKKVYLESAGSGMGKSRRAAGEACGLAVGWFYDTEKEKWINTGMCESVLLISTELEIEEVQPMFLAYVSGVDEKHILDGRYAPGERERVYQAAKYLKEADLFFVAIADYDIEDIENLIKKYHLTKEVDYVFYDYLSSSMKIMAEGAKKTRVSNLREDQILFMFMTRLKDLANLLGIHIQTATQLSGEWKGAAEVDNRYLRGSKAIMDKADIASILMPVRESDRAAIDEYCSRGFELKPNVVFHVFKVRQGSYNNVKVFAFFDRGTCRLMDCFVTDKENRLINVESSNIEIVLDETRSEEIPETVQEATGITTDKFAGLEF